MKKSIIVLLLSSLVLTGCFEKKDETGEQENNPALVELEDTTTEAQENTEILEQELPVEEEEKQGEENNLGQKPIEEEVKDESIQTVENSDEVGEKTPSQASSDTEKPVITPLGGSESTEISNTPSGETEASSSSNTEAENQVIEKYDEDLEELFKELLE